MAKHRRRSDDDESCEDSKEEESNDSRERRRHKHKKDQKHQRKHKKKHRKRESKRTQEEEEDIVSDGSDSEREQQSRHKRKKERKRPKRERRETTPQDDESMKANPSSHLLTQALCRLFSARPVFAQELPILLIRLAGGSTFDLRQMNDYDAANALESVLECLKDFGVQQKNGEWLFQALPGRRDERVLLRVIRSQLDDVGVTLPAVTAYDAKAKEQLQASLNFSESKADDASTIVHFQDLAVDRIKDLTSSVVLKYQATDSELGLQLAGLCQTIAQGESISIDGIPDESLKASLEEIFLACGLEKSEMANEDGSEDDNDEEEEPTMGYGLPENANDSIPLRLVAVMEACRNPKRRTLGPMRPTQEEATTTYNSDDEDEGPTLPGQERRLRGPAVPDYIIKAQAEHRELELKATAAGVDIPSAMGGREEWMVVPGKYDFLSNIKSGQPMKSRGFENKKTRGGDEEVSQAPIHPAIQAEMDAIMQAHKEARGPSLFDQHRAKKQQEKAAEAGKKQEWSWKRDKDLDEGRRVDKDALHMVLGGAKDNLKTKFHGGFS